MLIAVQNQKRIKAYKGAENCSCPICNQEVVAKCGELMIWHFAHKTNDNNCIFGKGKGNWHYLWQNKFPIDCVEYKKDNHIADIFIKETAIELQESPISLEEIKERNLSWGDNTIWIVSADKPGFEEQMVNDINTGEHSNNIYDNLYGLSFNSKNTKWYWRYPKKALLFGCKNLYFDLGEYSQRLLHILTVESDLFVGRSHLEYDRTVYHGLAEWVKKEDFLKKFLN